MGPIWEPVTLLVMPLLPYLVLEADHQIDWGPVEVAVLALLEVALVQWKLLLTLPEALVED